MRQIVCLFFFQAEDGIRDLIVTGVQTWLFRSKSKTRKSKNSKTVKVINKMSNKNKRGKLKSLVK